ncbi:TetR/AcrR family transcriptional regulator [Kineococcus sp. SYSU DK003]|uniref:TetR/AcrR family transcriptional regulator n=1 Tax=Kineococcus sp. SYSU DK003 TaxID=3383124 RepID=UPI003D7D122B
MAPAVPDQPTSPLAAVWARWSAGALDDAPEARPGRPGLSLRRIVEAAIELADAEGLDGLSMARVAKALGYTPMSLYRHVGSKEELLLHMQEQAVGEPPAHLAPSGDWRADLERWCWEATRRMRLHPWFLQAVTQLGAPSTPRQLAWFDLALACLEPAPLSEGEKLSALLLLNAHSFGDLTFEAADHPSEVAQNPYLDEVPGFVDAQRYPALARAFAGGAFTPSEDPAADRDEIFSFGLQRILDGLEVFIAHRRRA